MSDLSFAVLQQAVAERQKEYPGTEKITLEFRGLELAEEAGEVAGAVKKLVRERLGIAGKKGSVERVNAELGDLLITAALLANDLGIDLSHAVRTAFNGKADEIGLSFRLPDQGEQAGSGSTE